jgi:hypothetical protein
MHSIRKHRLLTSKCELGLGGMGPVFRITYRHTMVYMCAKLFLTFFLDENVMNGTQKI